MNSASTMMRKKRNISMDEIPQGLLQFENQHKKAMESMKSDLPVAIQKLKKHFYKRQYIDRNKFQNQNLMNIEINDSFMDRKTQ